ncbi:hypothetical protein Leryth_019234 [Lithospermum erythrorhizon]|nr:hypothetical protein Leryth_019234 [Lithospermum erythrorhizon]
MRVNVNVEVIIIVALLCCMQFNSIFALDDHYGVKRGTGLTSRSYFNLNNKTNFGLAEDIYGHISDVTSFILNSEVTNQSDYCIKDPQLEWDRAFNYSSDLGFLSACLFTTNGDMAQRLCTAAEIKFYFHNFVGSLSGDTNYLKPNKNCNLTSWVSGCEPGWACSAGDQTVDLEDSHQIPARSVECQPCCEGFFCPQGITCMIPCPLGSYCPLATLNKNTGVCEPYSYQLPPGQSTHSCGGANSWADFSDSQEVFCSAGSHCPTPVEQFPCTNGNYCPAGSTAEKRCYKLASCDAKTSSQNIHAYGAMLIASLGTLLLLIYSCSGKIITVRERRVAKLREAAVRSVREKVQAPARWKTVKASVKEHHEYQISLASNCKKLTSGGDKTDILEKKVSVMKDDIDASDLSGDTCGEKSLKTSHLLHIMQDSEGFHHSFDSISLDMENKGTKIENIKDKEIHTRSDMYKYVYAQLEKEKEMHMNPNMTFSEVMAMGTSPETIRRPLMEIAFNDLTVTLKGKSKRILTSVTGKIMPGRITAVMGPSGAGKTTFLSALAGKIDECRISGLILINGEMESIHSYKKIVGFVPQDDIVHGNLTVEENLWFSARCRLSADLPHPEKVLIVERVISSLGLHAIRSSLVGTVENRGISGGQRKRVNVGLELVMKPSVLFLDEPTSGLDSSTSHLLLKALRREALEGVNICMVVHQPSYTLFKMFDDLVLLAKEGISVYHGSVCKVEEFFAGFGIIVPERVNPPDYYIDVLEGMVKPNYTPKRDNLENPIRWMLRHGYPVTPDIQQDAARLSISAVDENEDDSISSYGDDREDHSFAEERWQEKKCHVERLCDILYNNFFKTKDLSNRRTPNVLQQYKYFLGRVSKQRLREARVQAIDYLILLLAGACLGSLIQKSDDSFGAPGYTYTIIAVSLLSKIAALRSFSLDKLQYRRESGSGICSLAHFVAKDTTDHFNTLIKPLVYLSMYYFFSNPRSSFGDNYLVLLCL